MVEAGEPPAQVLADVAAEKRRRAEAPVLRDVGELVGEKSECAVDRIFHARRRRPRQEDPPPENDRARPGERSQESREPAAVETGPFELVGKYRAKLSGEDGGNPAAGHGPYEPARVLRKEAICFSSTSYAICPERTSSFQESTGPPFACAGRNAQEDIARRR